MSLLSKKDLLIIIGGNNEKKPDGNVFTCIFSWFKQCP